MVGDTTKKNNEQEKKGGSSPFFSSVRRVTLINSILFILGFSTVNIALGLLASSVSGFFNNYAAAIRIVGGVLILIFGVYLLGLLPLKFFERELRLEISKRRFGYVGTYLIGMAFAAGWTPCTGPILGAILGMAMVSGQTMESVLLLAFYSMGLGLPFFLSALLLNYFIKYYGRIAPYLGWFQKICGVLLVGISLILLTDSYNKMAALFAGITGGGIAEPDFVGVNLLTAFVAGLFAFLSPCVLPLIPSYVTFITGISIDEYLDE
jgi:cytochrome c-type biogenesis protein